ncbi:minor capsid protein [Metabacillus sp. FJAT-53654]|uniref:Minor capsid protein n=1 Tax=Metabacillus rhizosphaerae TaxID=3117747 RepID=A0ABZ2MYL9_9BACI
MLSFKTHIKMQTRKLKAKKDAAYKDAQFNLDSQILKDSNFFIPMQELNLARSGILHSRLGLGLIRWKTKYARRLYYNPQYNFSHDVNPNAQGLWYEAAKALNKDAWKEIVQETYNKHFDGK